MPRPEIALYEQHAQNAADLWRGLFGGGSAIMAFTLSHIEQIEVGLRIISLIVGILVGIATLWKICRRR